MHAHFAQLQVIRNLKAELFVDYLTVHTYNQLNLTIFSDFTGPLIS